ncbi:flagellar biosynthesis anti-sigma factor FlgM [Alteromonas sp. CYL-A6]|uniref:flagellar biosynthesis anti-sigma factor FlgM n=1 Tax=Alteromonas nitratireducens TaxID=3390813 RepID=UPI0034B27C72
MAINNVNNNGIPKQPLDNAKVNQQNHNQAAQQQAVAKSAVAPRQDSVSLTQSAQQLNQVQKRSNEAPVNQEKVDKLKKAIQNGEYRVNPEVLAQKIARMESEIFGGKS